MAGKTPEEALDAFLGRFRQTLSCITDAFAYAAKHARLDHPNSLTLFDAGQKESGRIHLLTHAADGEIFLRLAHEFTIRHVPEDAVRGPYKVSSSYYQYKILDVYDREVMVYDWHPSGSSTVTVPHLHVSCVGAIELAQRDNSRLVGAKTYLGDFHIPTGRVFLEDIAELLVREFKVDPRREDWEEVISDNREAVGRGRTW